MIAKSISEAVTSSLSDNNGDSQASVPTNPPPVNPFKSDEPKAPVNRLEPWPEIKKESLSEEKPVGESSAPDNPVPANLPGAMPVAGDSSAQAPSIPRPVFSAPPKPIQPASPATVVVPPNESASPTFSYVPPEFAAAAVIPKAPPGVPPAPVFMPPSPAMPSASAIPGAPKNEAGLQYAPPNQPPPLKNIRTYESDIADVLAHRGTTRTSMAISESVKRGEGETLSNASIGTRTGAMGESEPSSHFVRRLFIVIISLILLAAGVIGGYYLYSQSPLGVETPLVAKPTTMLAIIPYESQAVLTTDGLKRADLINKFRDEMAKPQAGGTIKEIVMTEQKSGVTYRIATIEMSEKMTLKVPDILLRTLSPNWMLGVYAGADDNTRNAFVIVTTNLFQNAFVGMLNWEGGIPEDLKDILSSMPASASTTASTTFVPALRGRFEDRIIKNKDVRAFVTEDGRTAFSYSFVDNSTLVVAENSDTLAAIITRLDNRAFVR